MHFFFENPKIEFYMSPMKNPIMGIENLLVEQLFKSISIFEKNLNNDLKFWILDFLCYFCIGFWVANMLSFRISILLAGGVCRSIQRWE